MDAQTKAVRHSPSGKTSLRFPQGLYGFEEYTDFTLCGSEYDPFMWLQSDTDKTLSFLVVDPFLFFPDYELDVDDENVKYIGVQNACDVSVLAIVTLPKKGSPITVNLQGPLVINMRNGQGKQIVLQDSRWLTKHDLYSASDKRSTSC